MILFIEKGLDGLPLIHKDGPFNFGEHLTKDELGKVLRIVQHLLELYEDALHERYEAWVRQSKPNIADYLDQGVRDGFIGRWA